ncbi:MAG TPA: hypothetical protein VFV92_08490, partial [Candidatus Bathyarchaeia archaeon]|nr:hypothetical protein [Candidatus Bathyarchaeia archaeon]
NVGIFEIKPFENIPDFDWASTLPPRDVFAYTYTVGAGLVPRGARAIAAPRIMALLPSCRPTGHNRE